jgi:hypothetical protein
VGAVIAAWLGSGHLLLGSIVGFVTLFGITMRNSIMLILHFRAPSSRRGKDDEKLARSLPPSGHHHGLNRNRVGAQRELTESGQPAKSGN